MFISDIPGPPEKGLLLMYVVEFFCFGATISFFGSTVEKSLIVDINTLQKYFNKRGLILNVGKCAAMDFKGKLLSDRIEYLRIIEVPLLVLCELFAVESRKAKLHLPRGFSREL